MSDPPRAPFVHVENASRRRVAEGLPRRHAPRLAAAGAGTRPGPRLSPLGVGAPREAGIDITRQGPKELACEVAGGPATVNVGCVGRESCPALHVGDVVDWDIMDPKGCGMGQVRRVRRVRDRARDRVPGPIRQPGARQGRRR